MNTWIGHDDKQPQKEFLPNRNGKRDKNNTLLGSTTTTTVTTTVTISTIRNYNY